MGKKSKLTRPLCNEFCKAIENGASILAACGHVNIVESTYYRWYNKGRDAKRNTKFKKFYEAVEIAKNKALYNFEGRIVNEADNGTWTAAAWWLERRYPEIYGKKVKQEIDSKVEAEVKVPFQDLERIVIESGKKNDKEKRKEIEEGR